VSGPRGLRATIDAVTSPRPWSTRVRGGLLVAAVCAVSSACSTSSSGSSAPAAPPSAALTAPALAGWQLTLPVANDKGTASILKPAQVSPPYLTTDPSGGLVFWAPVDGATTEHSDHARTELDRTDNFVAGAGRHTLTATVVVNQVPSGGKDVIIAQIHGAESISSVPYVMLHWDDGELKVVVKQELSGSVAKDYPLTSDVPLGAPFDIGITDNGDGTMTFTASYQGDNPNATAPVPAAFAGATVRFQVGAYQQDLSTGATAAPDDGARVTFTSLNTS